MRSFSTRSLVGDRSRGSTPALTAFSVTGVAPLGAFLIVHGASWSLAAHRPELMRWSWSGPLLGYASLALIWLPLAYHAGYGVACWLGLASAPHSPPGVRRICRLTGPLVLLFMLGHGLELALPLWTGAILASDLHGRLCDLLASTSAAGVPWRSALYLAGAALTVTHFAAGCYALCARSQRLRSRLSERALRRLCTVFGVLVLLPSVHAVLYFATGGLGQR